MTLLCFQQISSLEGDGSLQLTLIEDKHLMLSSGSQIQVRRLTLFSSSVENLQKFLCTHGAAKKDNVVKDERCISSKISFSPKISFSRLKCLIKISNFEPKCLSLLSTENFTKIPKF